MKFQVTFKDPDTLLEELKDVVRDQLRSISGLGAEEVELLIEKRRDKLSEFCGQWIDHGEYVTVEFDTEAKTAIVVPSKRHP